MDLRDTTGKSQVTPVKLKQLVPAAMHHRQRLYRALPLGAGPYIFPTLEKVCGCGHADLIVERIGNQLPSLSESFLAVAMLHRNGAIRTAMIFRSDAVQHIIDLCLQRQPGGASDFPVAFDQGVFIQILALAISDLACYAVTDIEIRGVLNSSTQLELFFSNAAESIWHLQSTLRLDAFQTPCLLVGNGLLPDIPPNHLPTRITQSMGQLPVTFRGVIGHTMLPCDALRQLSEGDVVTIDKLAWPASSLPPINAVATLIKNEIHLYSGYVALAANWENLTTIRVNEVKSTGDTHKENNDMNDHMNDPLENTQTHQMASPLDPGDADVSCTVEIADLRISVRQLTRLLPGQVIPLNRPVTESVQLVADGQVICRGELVQVADELAIEITEVP